MTLPAQFKLPVKFIPQNPELPTGCEAVSLTTVLNYIGYDVDKFTIVDKFLPKGPVGPTDPYLAFPGDPYSLEDGWGCFAPCIVKTANDYIESVGGKDKAIDISHTPMEEMVEKYLFEQERPIVFWGSMGMVPHVQGPTWDLGDRTYTWRNNNHCLVLIGWDEENYIFSDPLEGIMYYKKDIVKERYTTNDEQAVFIVRG